MMLYISTMFPRALTLWNGYKVHMKNLTVYRALCLILCTLSDDALEYLSGIKGKSVSEHAQNVWVHNILHTHKVSSGPLLSIDTFYSIQ